MSRPATLGRLVAAAWVLIRADALIPRELDPILPPPARRIARTLRLFRGRAAREGRPGQRLARALEHLGPAAIKLGQVLSTRADIFGRTFADDLSRLKDQLPPFPTAIARRIIAADLDMPVEALFVAFGEPIAAASLAQAHPATLADGRAVAVKVLRPGIERRVSEDIEVLHMASGLLERAIPLARRLEPRALAGIVARSLELELDLRLEAAGASELREVMALDGYMRAPARGLGRGRQAGADPGLGRGGGPVRSRRARPARPRSEGAGRQSGARLSVPGPGPRGLSRRSARRQSVRRPAERHHGGGLRHRRPPGRGGAPPSGRDPVGLFAARLHARGQGAFRRRLCARPPFDRGLRPGPARGGRAQCRPALGRGLDGQAPGPAVRDHRHVRHAPEARTGAAPEDHGHGRGRRPQDRSRPQPLGGGGTGGAAMDHARAVTRDPPARTGRRCCRRSARAGAPGRGAPPAPPPPAPPPKPVSALVVHDRGLGLGRPPSRRACSWPITPDRRRCRRSGANGSGRRLDDHRRRRRWRRPRRRAVSARSSRRRRPSA